MTGAGGIVTGYRSPSWDVSPHTLDLLEAKELTYTSQFMDDFRPYRHRDRRLVELPVQWILDDWPHFAFDSGDTGPIRSTPEIEVLWKEEFDGIHRYGGSYILTMHPQIIGRPSRVARPDGRVRAESHGRLGHDVCRDRRPRRRAAAADDLAASLFYESLPEPGA